MAAVCRGLVTTHLLHVGLLLPTALRSRFRPTYRHAPLLPWVMPFGLTCREENEQHREPCLPEACWHTFSSFDRHAPGVLPMCLGWIMGTIRTVQVSLTLP